MLKSLLHRLFQQNYLSNIPDDGTINTYTYTYMGRLVEQRITVNPMLKYEIFKRICRNAISGSLTDMSTVAMMYNVGFGLPANQDAALAWAGFATLDVNGSAKFDEACKQLRVDYTTGVPAEIYPDQLTLPCLYAIERLQKFDIKVPDGIFAVPQFTGMRVYLFYRKVPGIAPHLYAAFCENQFVDMGKLIALGVPRYLGEHNRRIVTVENYLPDNMIVAVATIASVGNNSAQYYFDKWDGSPLKDVSEFEERPDAEMIRTLTSEVSRLTRRLERTGEAEVHDKLQQASEKLKKMESETYDKDVAYAQYLKRTPRSYLKLVVTEMYEYRERSGFVAVGSGRQLQQLMQTYGFPSLVHPALEKHFHISAKTVNDAKTAFEKATGLTVNGFLMQTKPDTAVRRFPLENE